MTLTLLNSKTVITGKVVFRTSDQLLLPWINVDLFQNLTSVKLTRSKLTWNSKNKIKNCLTSFSIVIGMNVQCGILLSQADRESNY